MTRTHSTILALLFIVGVLLFAAQIKPPEIQMQAAIAQASSNYCLAIDGDTLVCRVGLDRIHLRLNGIDAPELPGHCRKGRNCAPGDPFASKANMAALVTGKLVTWHNLGTDKYGRTIAEAFVGSVDVQCAQLRGGYAIYKYRWDNHKVLKHSCSAAVGR